MNVFDVLSVNEKFARVRSFFEQTGYQAMIIGRRDNFAWLTCGGDNHIHLANEYGVTLLVVTKGEAFTVSQVMDGQRVQDEELAGLGFQGVFLRWFEESREEKAAGIVRGMRTLSDIPVEGADFLPGSIFSLHYPLTENELERCRRIGRETEGVIRKVADEIVPGCSERDVGALFAYEYSKIGMALEVLLIGGDDRIAKYRHTVPSDNRIDRVALLHPAVKKWGLHANVTRMVSFGEPDKELKRRYDASSAIEAAAMSMCVPGTKYRDILAVQKELYTRFGFSDEWKNHYKGASTGYFLADMAFYRDPEATIGPNQAWDWFITITGAKVEELALNTSNGLEIPSVSGQWPVKEFEYKGRLFMLPEILVK